MICTKKNCSGQMGNFDPENGTSSELFLKFCTMKGANRYMKILLVVFQEKNSFGAIWSF